MSSKTILVLASLLVFLARSVYSDSKTPVRSSHDTAHQQDSVEADSALVHRLVQVARARFETGNLEAADKILQAALEIQPKNNEAWYYSDLVQKAIRANKNRDVRLWYPTIPPRPAGK